MGGKIGRRIKWRKPVKLSEVRSKEKEAERERVSESLRSSCLSVFAQYSCKTIIHNKFYLVVVVLVFQSCPTLCNSMDCSPPGSSVHGILQARILEWVAIPFSRGFS